MTSAAAVLRVPALSFRRRVPVVLQAEAAECGLACLAMVSQYHGLDCDLSTLRAKLSASMRGITLAQLMQMASELGFSARALRLELSGLSQLQTPCILHWNLDHFVVLERVKGDQAWILDPAFGRSRRPLSEVSSHFSGVALELTPTADFRPQRQRSSLTLAPFFRSAQGLTASLAKILSLSLAIQVLTLAAPFYSQLLIDEVVASRDLSLLAVLAVGFGVLAMLNVCIGTARSVTVLYLGANLQFGWAVRLFHHLIRLPLAYFERRSMADVLSRFRSLSTIQGLASSTIVEAVIDGLMTITTILVMLYYSPVLTLISVVALALYAVVRAVVYVPQRELSNESMLNTAKEDGHFLESLRGTLAIKSFGREQVRESAWQNRAADAIRSRMSLSLLSTGAQVANQLLFALEGVLVLWLGATLVIDGGFSIGMLVAYLAFKSQFTARASALIDKAMEFQLAAVPLERISDIALAERDDTDGGKTDVAPQGHLELRNLRYRYAPTDPWVIFDANLTVQAGECIAISAPSGSGKTTLIKIMMGLLKPEQGQVLIDGADVGVLRANARRPFLAGVMQEDTLFSGTLIENITFFDPNPDMDRIETCARAAHIHDDICRMAMRYHTLVGDMGAALSGGQKQRILLARALYASPRLLFLDEATAHLDPATERSVHQAIAKLDITRVIVAHRAETLAIAERVLSWDEIQQSGRAAAVNE